MASPDRADLRIRLVGAAISCGWAAVAYVAAHALARGAEAVADPALAATLGTARGALIVSALLIPVVVFVGISLLRLGEARRTAARLRPAPHPSPAVTRLSTAERAAAFDGTTRADGIPYFTDTDADDGISPIDYRLTGDTHIDAPPSTDDIGETGGSPTPDDTARVAPPSTSDDTQGDTALDTLDSHGVDASGGIHLLPPPLSGPLPPLPRETARFIALMARSPFAIAVLDRDLRYLACSERWLEVYRLTGQELVGRHHYDVFPEIPGRWRAIHRMCLAGQNKQSDGEAFTRADGRVEWLRWAVRPGYDDAGAIGGIVMMSDMITAQKQAEEALAEQVAELETTRDALARLNFHLEAAARVAGLGYWIWDPATGALEWSGEMYRIYGIEPGTPVDTTVAGAHLLESDRAFAAACARKSLTDGGPFRYRLRIRRSDGELRIVNVAGEVDRPAKGAIGRVFGVMLDVTAQVEAERLEGTG